MREVIKEGKGRLLRIDGLGMGFFDIGRGEWMEETKEKKPGLFERLYASKKKQVLFFVISMIVLVTVYIPTIYIVRSAREKDIVEKQNIVTDYKIMSNVEKVEERNGILEISGWVLRLNSKNSNIRLVLQATDASDAKLLNVDMKQRDEIARYFVSNEEFGACGFIANLQEEELENDTCYEILIVLDYEEEKEIENDIEVVKGREKIAIGRYLYNGELYQYNPLEYEKPIVQDEEYVQVINNGNVLAYDIEKKCWIYEYQSNLYCIFDFSLFGELDNRPEIPLFIYSSQYEELNIEDSAKEYIGYYLNEVDYEEHSGETYFLYRVSMQKEYPITRVETGIYLNDGEHKGWIWKANLRNAWSVK